MLKSLYPEDLIKKNQKIRRLLRRCKVSLQERSFTLIPLFDTVVTCFLEDVRKNPWLYNAVGLFTNLENNHEIYCEETTVLVVCRYVNMTPDRGRRSGPILANKISFDSMSEECVKGISRAFLDFSRALRFKELRKRAGEKLREEADVNGWEIEKEHALFYSQSVSQAHPPSMRRKK